MGMHCLVNFQVQGFFFFQTFETVFTGEKERHGNRTMENHSFLETIFGTGFHRKCSIYIQNGCSLSQCLISKGQSLSRPTHLAVKFNISVGDINRSGPSQGRRVL